MPIQNKIKQHVKRFDLCSLLKLLQEVGYKEEDIYFQSHSDLSSRAGLCEDIFFSENQPRVTLILNIGLLSANSPLPSYFRKKMDAGTIDPVLFTRYLSYFDHHLIKNLLAMSMPETNGIFFRDWTETQGHYLTLLDLNSTSTLWHLFQICFPELIVKAEKSPRLFQEKSSSNTLGKTRLGVDTFLGKKIEQAIPSFKFTLTGEHTLTDQLVPWPLEVKHRLKNVIFPLLSRTSIHFRVILCIKKNGEIARLSPHSHMGYCRMGENKHPLKLLLFSGDSRNLAR